MPIDKVGFSGLDHTLPLSSQSKRDKVPNELTESSDNEISNASKYMIGAAALAGVVALGIIGHKNNWWRKASQAAEDLKPKTTKESETLKPQNTVQRNIDDSPAIDTEIILNSDSKEFQKLKNGTRIFRRNLPDNCLFECYDYPPNQYGFSSLCLDAKVKRTYSLSLKTGTYNAEKVLIDGEEYFNEQISAYNQILTKKFDRDSQTYKFFVGEVECTEDEFNKVRNYVIRYKLPDNIFKGIIPPRSEIFPKNIDYNFIIPMGNQRYEIRYPDSFNLHYEVNLDKNGRISGFRSYNPDGTQNSNLSYGLFEDDKYTLAFSKQQDDVSLPKLNGTYEELKLDKLYSALFTDTNGVLEVLNKYLRLSDII